MAKKKKKPSLDATLDRLRGDKKKREKIPAYLRSTLPQSKFILQPTDIQKMLPAEVSLELRVGNGSLRVRLLTPVADALTCRIYWKNSNKTESPKRPESPRS